MDLPPQTDSANLAATGKNVDNARRSMLATIMHVDLVAHSPPSLDQQIAIRKLLSQLLANTLDKVNAPSHIATDPREGVAICFTGDPKEALDSARLLRDLLQIKKYSQQGSIRIGLHFGAIRVIKGVNQRLHAVGDEINVAQRIMNFSQNNQIIVSHPYFDIVSSVSERVSAQFVHIGERQDRDKHSHNLYVVVDSNIVHSPIAVDSIGIDAQPTLPAASLIAHGTLVEIETDLAKVIGPLAKVLVKKASLTASTGAQLREHLGLLIPDAALREEFIQAASNSAASGRSAPSGKAPARESRNGPNKSADSTESAVDHQQNTVPKSGAIKPDWLTDDQQSQIERALGGYIGPLAKTLVRKAIAEHSTFQGFLNALAQQIDLSGDRQQFLTSARKIHDGKTDPKK